VPTTAPTLTVIRTAEPLYAGGAHASVVADVQALLTHTSAAASVAVAVGSTVPKLSPVIVTACPLCGEFRPMSDATALSKLNRPVSVPTIELALTEVLTVEPP
jgi:hypothetical protein